MTFDETAALIKRIKDGDGQAFSTLYNAYKDAVYYRCKKILQSEQAAEDGVQDVFLIVYQKLDKLSDAHTFPRWLNVLTANYCKNKLSRGNHDILLDATDDADPFDEIEDFDESIVPGNNMERAETRRLVQEMVDHLPEAQRLCVMMHYFDEMSVVDIAAALQVSENTVKSRLNYARKSMRNDTEELKKNGTPLFGMAPLGILSESLQAEAAVCVLEAAPSASILAAITAETAKTGMALFLSSAAGKLLIGGVAAAAIGIGVWFGGGFVTAEEAIPPAYPDPVSQSVVEPVEPLPASIPEEIVEVSSAPSSMPEVVPISSLAMPYSALTLEVGDTVSLAASIIPENATERTLSYASANGGVASITQNGMLTAVASGETTVHASAANGISVSCSVTVIRKNLLEYLELYCGDSEGYLGDLYEGGGERRTVEAIPTPDNADMDLVWEVSHSRYVSVSQSGVVKLKKAPPEDIWVIVRATDEYTGISAEWEFLVLAADITPTLDALELYCGSDDGWIADMYVGGGEIRQLDVYPTPADAEYDLQWTSSDPSCATVSQNGQVTLVDNTNGTEYVTITATDRSTGISAEWEFYICP